MKVTYDPWADAVYIYICSKKGDLETKAVDDGLMVDIDHEDRVVGVEILNASSRLDVESLKTFEFIEHGPQTPYEPAANPVGVNDPRSHYKNSGDG